MPVIRRTPRHDALRAILTARREAAGLTQVTLAERLDRPQSFVAKVENGERRIDVVEFLQISEALGCPPEDILAELRLSGMRDVAVPKAGTKRRPKRD